MLGDCRTLTVCGSDDCRCSRSEPLSSRKSGRAIFLVCRFRTMRGSGGFSASYVIHNFRSQEIGAWPRASTGMEVEFQGSSLMGRVLVGHGCGKSRACHKLMSWQHNLLSDHTDSNQQRLKLQDEQMTIMTISITVAMHLPFSPFSSFFLHFFF